MGASVRSGVKDTDASKLDSVVTLVASTEGISACIEVTSVLSPLCD
ncbi:hypothetical protein N9189_01865 [Pirellulaceae bacterium]|nr:hypothetical protein [Pirellulaceae bacterium]